MSLDAGSDLFKAVRAALLADTYLVTQLGNRVFSTWDNQDVATPMIRMSAPVSRMYEIDGAGEGSDTDLWVHVFTAESSTLVCRAIATKVRALLGGNDLALDGSNTVAIDYRDTLMRRDDTSPLLQIAIVRFRALTTTK